MKSLSKAYTTSFKVIKLKVDISEIATFFGGKSAFYGIGVSKTSNS